MSVKLEQRHFINDEGLRLAYYVTGPEGAVPFVISAGLGGGVHAWDGIIERIADRLRIYAWDYRGLYGSEPAPDVAGYGTPCHAADLLRLIDHEAIEAPVLAGWSMGVQVNFELLRHHPDRPKALVALHGASGYPLRTAFDSRLTELIAPPVFAAMRRYWWLMKHPAKRLARSRHVTRGFMIACQKAGIMDQACDADLFHIMARDWVKLDLPAYVEIFERLGEHDAGDVLPRVPVPTLVVAGGKDPFTPPHLSEAMVQRIPDAELFVVPRATHFGPLEYPAEIADRIKRFLASRFGDLAS